MEDSKLKHDWKKAFFPFFISQMVSILGSALVMFTLVWWLTEKTGSATVLATATMVGMVPEIVVQPFAGAIVDRLNRKMVIILSDGMIALATLILGILFYFDLAGVWAIYGLMFIRAIGGAFHYPAEQASVALMVPDDQLARLAGLNQAARGIINIVAAPLGALVLVYMDVEGAMLIDVFTAAIAIGIVAVTTIPRQEKLEDKGNNWLSTVLIDLKDGFNYLIQWKALVMLIVIALIFKVALTPAFSLIPLLVYEHLLGNAAQYSLVEVVSGIGIISGGLVLSVWGGFKRQVYTMFLGLCGVGLGILLIGFIPAGQFTLLLPLMFLVGFMVPIIDGPLGAILQSKVDNEYQGRVTTLLGSIINLSGPIGLVLAGPLSDRFGLQIWFITAGLLIFISFAIGFMNKELMRIDEGPSVNEKVSEKGYIVTFDIPLIISISGFLLWAMIERVYHLSGNRQKKGRRIKENSFVRLSIVWYLIIAISYLDSIYFGWTLKIFSYHWVRWTGTVLIIAGLVLRVIARRVIGKQYSLFVETSQDHQLITNGIYAFIRHPAYLGLLALLIGIPVAAWSMPGFLVAIIFWIPVLLNRIMVEEKALEKWFGDDYWNYSNNTWRLIPFLW